MQGSVLFVDDDPNLLEGLKRSLHRAPYHIETAGNGQAALDLLAVLDIDVVVTDQQMPGMPGTELLSQLREGYPRIIRIMLAGQATIGAAVNAVNEGAVFRFLLKPCGAQEVDLAVRQGLAQKILMDRSWSLLRYVRWQTSMLEILRAEHPTLVAEAMIRCSPTAAALNGDDLPLAMAQELDRIVKLHGNGS
jgi:DNA-binding NtrC family response regulator